MVVFGVYGSTLDAGGREKRWERWRPSVALCRHEDLVVDRFEFLHTRGHKKGASLVANDIEQISPETEVRLHAVGLSDPWDFEEVFATLHDFARSYRFQPDAEDYYVHITTGTHVMQICWFLLTESRHFPAQLLQTSPPDRRNRTEPGTYRTIDLDLSRYDRLASRFEKEKEESLTFLKSGIETRNAAFNRLIEGIERVALRSREPMLLTGPTGAGKSRLARQIYELKKQRKLVSGAFVEANCATIRGDGAMSSLFGHVKGAYTGASKDRPGLLRSANKGMLLLDEIGELGLDEQAMLLRAVEERRFLPVGTDKETQSDFTLIAGTNRDLRARIAEGLFREDLYARINLWTFELPGLADRKEDIEPNLDFELSRTGQRTGHQVSMNREARERFLSFATSSAASWRGNFRDFNAAIIRMATLAPSGRIDLATVEEEIKRLRAWWQTTAPATDSAVIEELIGEEAAREIDPFDRPQLRTTIEACRSAGTLSEAGRQLFAVSRTRKKSRNDADRLRKYLQRFGLTWSDIHR